MSFNVRIQNKYDTLQNWLDSSLVLKAGEIALATVDTKSADGSQYIPTVLMKVGDGSQTFKQLPWAAAKAADVYGWAKLENPSIDDLPGNLKKAITDLQAAVGDGGSVADAIKAAIEGLDVTDTAVEKQFVTAVAQENGKVKISRRALEAADIPALEIDKINGLQSALDGKLPASTFNSYKSTNDAAVQANAKAIADEATRATGVEAQLRTDVDAKVEKKTGFSLVSDEEITKLAGVSEGANKVEASETNGKIKIDGVETVVYTHPDKHTVSEISDFDASVKAYGYATTAESQKYTDDKANELAAWVTENAYELAVTANANATTALKNAAKAQSDVNALETYVGTIPADATATNIVGYIQEKTTGIATEDALTALSNRVGTIEGDYLTSEDKTELEGEISAVETAVNTEKSRAEGIEAGLRTDVDAIKADYLKAADKTELQGNIDTLAGVVETLSDGIEPNKVDGVKDLIKYVDEHGSEVTGMKEDIADNAAAIKLESETARAAEEDLDLRVKALEEIDHDAYIEADKILKAELQKEIDDDVKAAIDAEVLRANGAYDEKGAAAAAQTAAINDAAGKYETKGTAQGLIDGLKLGETYEPIGAKDAAIAAAKTETEKQVKALADGAVADNAADIAKIVAGTTPVAKATNADELGGQAAEKYLLKSDAPGYADILTKTAAEAGYKKVQTAVAEKGAANKTLKISQNAQGVIATEEVDIAIAATQVSGLATVATSGKINDLTQTENTVIVFNCGTASTVI